MNKTPMQKPLNPKAVQLDDPFIIGERVGEVWKAIESQPDINKALKARDILAEHDVRVGRVHSNDDVRIFRIVNIVWEPTA